MMAHSRAGASRSLVDCRVLCVLLLSLHSLSTHMGITALRP